ncbi:MAG: RluA family pseudouridine synthase [Deltaproteobacteria bacterium]|uniref:RluA family pseudouridine synthase n=1 Tax=Hydrosulfovibrio ferrireducens TaxID=2934181 RepID=UPI0012167BE6|nr:MAG: RluA family pseudouridine synthase [Deltaproteobacteria bacterium]
MIEKSLFTIERGGQRLDQYLASRFEREGLTRSRIQQLIRSGMVLVNGIPLKAKHILQAGDALTVTIPPQLPSHLIPEQVDFVTLHEDEDLIVLIKPPGVVVHPAAGHSTATLVHGLLHHCGGLSGINGELRPGIVHRLDKDTSGVMVVAKTDYAHQSLAAQFKEREVTKIYQALVDGRLIGESGRVALPIGRHPVHRKKMAIREDGREAVTNWRVLERFAQGLALLELGLETGRTHQIRVHMAALSHPVAGDPVYGRKNPCYQELGITRQCLHAHTLAFSHPRTGEDLRFTAPLWPDMLQALELLRQAGGV